MCFDKSDKFRFVEGKHMSNAKYAEIINLPHHVSERHPQLGKASYAAQFSPFAALTGYDGIVSEAARVTEERVELDDDAKAHLNTRLQIVFDHIDEEPQITVTYFVADKKKAGGAYVTAEGTVQKYDEYERVITLFDGTRIPIDDVYDVRSEIITAFMPDEM